MTILILHGIMGYAGENWGTWLQDRLIDEGHVVLMPNLPNADKPDRRTWLDLVTRVLHDVDHKSLVIVGHSLGVTTALDYAEKHKLKGLISVAGFASPYGAELNDYFLKEKKIDLEKVHENVAECDVFYGDNDPYVARAALAEVARGLGCRPHIIHEGGHLNSAAGFTEFPALLQAAAAMA